MSLFKKTPPEVKQYKKELRSMFPKAMVGKISMEDLFNKLEEGVEKGIIGDEEYNEITEKMVDSMDKTMRLQRVIQEKSFDAIREKYQKDNGDEK